MRASPPVLLALLTVLAGGPCPSVLAAAHEPPTDGAESGIDPEGGASHLTPGLNRGALRQAVMAFADRYTSIFGQELARLRDTHEDPQAREAASGQIVGLFAAIEIAAQPSAGAALLDLAVLVTLQREIWASHWRPTRFGALADATVETLERLEGEVWKLLAQALTPGQQRELRELITDWRRANPDQVLVNFVRFSDFGELGRKPALEQIKTSGGLLAPVEDATEAVEEIRRTGERALYLISRMQLFASLQFEHAIEKLIARPELMRALDDISGFRSSVDRLVDVLEATPAGVGLEADRALVAAIARVRVERQAATDDVLTGIAREREAAISALIAGLGQERVGMVDHFMDRLEVERANAFVQLLEGVAIERELLLAEVGPIVDRSLLASELAAERSLDYGFRLAVVLVVLMFFVSGSYRFAAGPLITRGYGWVFPVALLIAVAAIAYWQFVLVPDERIRRAPPPVPAPDLSRTTPAEPPVRSVVRVKPAADQRATRSPTSALESGERPVAPMMSTPDPAPEQGTPARVLTESAAAGDEVPPAPSASAPSATASPASPAAAPADPAPALARPSYVIQISAHRAAAGADRHVDALRARDVEAHVRRVDLAGSGTYYRVLVGPFESRAAARAAQRRLASGAAGLGETLVRPARAP